MFISSRALKAQHNASQSFRIHEPHGSRKGHISRFQRSVVLRFTCPGPLGRAITFSAFGAFQEVCKVT
jgi:hypothetical protein